MNIIVSIALATICFTSNGIEECHPVLLGKNPSTPTGTFTTQLRRTEDPGYGGDVIQFYETNDTVYAIHRVWLLRPEQRRLDRLKSKNVKDRFISAGCINVSNEVYDKLINCCVGNNIIIK